MVFLWLLLAILLVGIVIFLGVKKSKVRQEELTNTDPVETLPKFKFDE